MPVASGPGQGPLRRSASTGAPHPSSTGSGGSTKALRLAALARVPRHDLARHKRSLGWAGLPPIPATPAPRSSLVYPKENKMVDRILDLLRRGEA